MVHNAREITILDYGLGNIGSISNMLNYLNIRHKVVSNEKELVRAEKLILPGIGHFGYAMERLKQKQLVSILNYLVVDLKIPTLGICLGMQLMCQYSEEADMEGLSWIDAPVLSFKKLFDTQKINLKQTHMGWGYVNQSSNPLLSDLSQQRRFYFVHSYYVPCNEHQIFTAQYGVEFCAGFCKNNIFGVQFHPEKSHRFGLELFKAFAAWKDEFTENNSLFAII